jgi:hypothetical protein
MQISYMLWALRYILPDVAHTSAGEMKYLTFTNLHPGPGSRLKNEIFARRYGRQGPAIDPFGILQSHIDAAMAVLGAEIIMPVRSMQCNTAIGNIRIPGHTRQVKNRELVRPAKHMISGALMKSMEPARGTFIVFPAGCDACGIDKHIPFIGQQQLPVEIDLYMLFIFGYLRREWGNLFGRKEMCPFRANVVIGFVAAS